MPVLTSTEPLSPDRLIERPSPSASRAPGAGDYSATAAPSRHPAPDPVQPSYDPVPLCVDLDGTLVKSDTLHDSLLLLLRTNPWNFLLSLWLLLRNRAHGKQFIARVRPLDVRNLPWNQAVVRFLRVQRGQNRCIVLATGADLQIAQSVAAHLGCFDKVLASTAGINLVGRAKLAALKAQFPSFDYIGNSRADLPLLASARNAILANPSPTLQRAIHRRRIAVSTTLPDRAPRSASLARALRLHQWVKNLLLFGPLLLAHHLSAHRAAPGLLAFLAFGCAASACYVFNDLLDLENDRRHSRKRLRPFASGDLGLPQGLALILLLLLLAATPCLFLPAEFGLWLAAYVAITALYSLRLKRIAIADVIVLSALYTLRLFAGGAATATAISLWLSSFAIFFFASLALFKRLNELEILRQQGGTEIPGRGYRVADSDLIRSLGSAAAYASLAIFALYAAHPDVIQLYPHPERLWLVLAPLAFWLLRMGMLASRGQLHEDPVLFALRDRTSLALAALILALAWSATR